MSGDGSRLRLSELPEGRLPADWERHDGVVVHSLTAHALESMERHKWIESEKAGRDLGETVMLQWLEQYWKGYVRAKLMEHLYGWRCWGAFDVEDYGLLSRTTVAFHVPRSILSELAAILRSGGENLDVIAWATEAGHDLSAVIWVLERIDINAKRHRLLTDHIRLFIDHLS
jgi:hypothetical protein